MSIHPKAVDASEHLRPLVETLARAEDRRVEWTGNALVWADPTRIRQVVRNLITNAFRYGGAVIRVVIIQEERWAYIEVRDSGSPIPAERVLTMFDPFDHADDGARTPNSVGLGLAIARTLSRMMGGELVYTHENDETVFRMSLPRPPDIADRLQTGSADQGSNGRPSPSKA